MTEPLPDYSRTRLAPIITRIRAEMADQNISAAELARRISPWRDNPSWLARHLRQGYITQCQLLDIAVAHGSGPDGRDQMRDRLLGMEE
jgi:hypothetical protein